MNYIDLGERVRTCRHKMKLTQADLAKQLGLSHSFVGHMERGTRAISLETFVALCNALEVSPAYLLSASLTSLDDHLPEWLADNDRKNWRNCCTLRWKRWRESK